MKVTKMITGGWGWLTGRNFSIDFVNLHQLRRSVVRPDGRVGRDGQGLGLGWRSYYFASCCRHRSSVPDPGTFGAQKHGSLGWTQTWPTTVNKPVERLLLYLRIPQLEFFCPQPTPPLSSSPLSILLRRHTKNLLKFPTEWGAGEMFCYFDRFSWKRRST